MRAVVTLTARMTKPIWLSTFFFVVVHTFNTLPAFGDSDCDMGINCEKYKDYWVKIKRLPEELELPDWGGEELISGSTGVSSGKDFCTIAFLEGKPREMFDLRIRIYGSSLSNNYLLKNGRHSIPVKFDIKNMPGKAPQVEQTFKPGDWLTLKGNKSYQQCRDNELMITASVSRQDIISSGITGTYTGSFRVYSQSTMNAISLGPVWMEFEVEIEILPVIQILGLKDITLQTDGNSATGSHEFCVFAMGVNKFSLEASSRAGTERPNQKFSLKNGNSNYIAAFHHPYQE